MRRSPYGITWMIRELPFIFIQEVIFDKESEIFPLFQSIFCVFNPDLVGYFLKIIRNDQGQNVILILAKYKTLRKEKGMWETSCNGELNYWIETKILKFLKIRLKKMQKYMNRFSARSITHNIQDKRCNNHTSVHKDEKQGS